LKKQLSTTFSNFSLNWRKGLLLCPVSSIYRQKQ
jgi:hypothetical protein